MRRSAPDPDRHRPEAHARPARHRHQGSAAHDRSTTACRRRYDRSRSSTDARCATRPFPGFPDLMCFRGRRKFGNFPRYLPTLYLNAITRTDKSRSAGVALPRSTLRIRRQLIRLLIGQMSIVVKQQPLTLTAARIVQRPDDHLKYPRTRFVGLRRIAVGPPSVDLPRLCGEITTNPDLSRAIRTY